MFCRGLENVKELNKYNIKNSLIKSDVLNKNGINYLNIENKYNYQEFIYSKENEESKENIRLLQDAHKFDISIKHQITKYKIYYITDLHLNHRIIKSKAKSKDDIIFMIQNIIDALLRDLRVRYIGKKILLIGGDVSSSFELYKVFIKLLRKSLDYFKLTIPIIFVLGNHELWDFPKKSINEIV